MLSVKQISKKLSVHRATVSRAFNKYSAQIAQFTEKRGNAYFISEEGLPVLAELMQVAHKLQQDCKEISAECATDTVCEDAKQLQQKCEDATKVQQELQQELQRMQKENETLISNLQQEKEQAREEKNYYRGLVDKIQCEKEDLQSAFLDSQHRHDTIVMSLTKRLEDIQKRLPELPAPNTKKPGVVKRFISWLTAPDQQTNVEWDDSKIFGKAN